MTRVALPFGRGSVLNGIAPLRTRAQVEARQVFRLAPPALLLLPGRHRVRGPIRGAGSF